MGALTVNRKRRFDDHCTTPNSIYYYYYSPPAHINNNNNNNNKKAKTMMSSSSSPLSNQIPISSQKKVIKQSRLDRYPGPVKELKREVHAPCSTTVLNKFASSSRRRRGTNINNNNNSNTHHMKRADVVERGNSHDYYNNNNNNEMGGNVFGKGSQHQITKRVPITTTTTSPLFWNNNKELEEQPIDVDDIEMGDIQFVDVVLGNDKIAAEFGDMELIDGSEIVTESSDEKDADSKMENINNNNRAITEIDEDDGKTSWDMVSFNQKMLLLGRPPVYKKLWEDAQERHNSKLSSLSFNIELNEKQRKKFQLLRPVKQPAQEVVSEQVLREAFLPLSEEEKVEVFRAFSDSNRRKVLATHDNSNIAITGEILQCLRPREWLNDEVINVYMELLKERERRDPKKYLNCHFFNTFFYKKLCSGQNKYDYKSVRRWTTQRKLGYALKDCDKIFVPIHRPYHWCLAIINKKDSKFQYLDSLGGTDSNVLKALARYYVEEVKDKSGENIDISSWKQENVTDLPAQKNGFDCGVFMVKYTDFYSRGLGLCFKQDNMPYFRLRTAKEILRLRAE